jgi:hypothetical protein
VIDPVDDVVEPVKEVVEPVEPVVDPVKEGVKPVKEVIDPDQDTTGPAEGSDSSPGNDGRSDPSRSDGPSDGSHQDHGGAGAADGAPAQPDGGGELGRPVPSLEPGNGSADVAGTLVLSRRETRPAASPKRSGSISDPPRGAEPILPRMRRSAPSRTRHSERGRPTEPSGLERVLAKARRLAKPVLKQTAFPLALLLIVLAFLGVQNRIDRRDPKLALAPVYREPDLSFSSPKGLL